MVKSTACVEDEIKKFFINEKIKKIELEGIKEIMNKLIDKSDLRQADIARLIGKDQSNFSKFKRNLKSCVYSTALFNKFSSLHKELPQETKEEEAKEEEAKEEEAKEETKKEETKKEETKKEQTKKEEAKEETQKEETKKEQTKKEQTKEAEHEKILLMDCELSSFQNSTLEFKDTKVVRASWNNKSIVWIHPKQTNSSLSPERNVVAICSKNRSDVIRKTINFLGPDTFLIVAIEEDDISKYSTLQAEHQNMLLVIIPVANTGIVVARELLLRYLTALYKKEMIPQYVFMIDDDVIGVQKRNPPSANDDDVTFVGVENVAFADIVSDMKSTMGSHFLLSIQPERSLRFRLPDKPIRTYSNKGERFVLLDIKNLSNFHYAKPEIINKTLKFFQEQKNKLDILKKNSQNSKEVLKEIETLQLEYFQGEDFFLCKDLNRDKEEKRSTMLTSYYSMTTRSPSEAGTIKTQKMVS